MAIEKYKTFLVSYQFEGAQWNVEIPALNWEEAEARLAHLHNAKIDGEILAALPVSTGPLAQIATTLQNAVQRLTRSD